MHRSALHKRIGLPGSFFLKAIILAGGLGERLRGELSGLPKPMAQVAGKPFLGYLIDQLTGAGIRDIVLSVGYKAEVIKQHFGDGSDFGARISYSKEARPLGTGGALRLAMSQITENNSLVLNGDSYCRVNLVEFLSFHREKEALCSLVAVRSNDPGDYGVLNVDKIGTVTSFSEKVRGGTGLINGGIYLLNRKIVSMFPPEEKFSLEYDFFPALINKGFYAFVTEGAMIDIGTPQRLKKASQFFYEEQ